ncbi:MAG: tetratricopeptide repeat protein [Bacteroidota bacterium]|nr:tetratricopeptide repeat protein [Bacteroidota bacterium]
MKKIILGLFICAGFTGFSQINFYKLNPNSGYKTLIVKLDSCFNAGYYKDSSLYYKGVIQLKNNQNNDAKKTCAELLKLFPDFNEGHYLKGLIYFTEKSYMTAIDEFGVVIAKDRKHVKALYNRSTAFGMIENYNKAIEDLDACVSLKPMYSQAYYSRAYWQEYLGNHAAAIKDYEYTINIDPKNYDAYLGLAYIYLNQKNKTKSCEIINNAIKSGSQIAEDLKENFCK